MASFYTVIKARFDADGTLVPSPFAALYMAQPPKSDGYPYCVLLPNEKSKLSRSFGGNTFHEEQFGLHIVDRTQELVEAHADLVQAAFKDCETALAVTGLSVLRLDKDTRRFEQVEKDLWECVLDYATEYEEAA